MLNVFLKDKDRIDPDEARMRLARRVSVNSGDCAAYLDKVSSTYNRGLTVNRNPATGYFVPSALIVIHSLFTMTHDLPSILMNTWCAFSNTFLDFCLGCLPDRRWIILVEAMYSIFHKGIVTRWRPSTGITNALVWRCPIRMTAWSRPTWMASKQQLAFLSHYRDRKYLRSLIVIVMVKKQTIGLKCVWFHVMKR